MEALYNNPMRSKSGFTIVELLIVIVVIAILAAISVVAYNNVQERAYNADLLSRMDAYEKGMKLYHIENGRFPENSAGSGCVGRPSDYPAENGYSQGSCMRWEGLSYSETYVDENFMNGLSTIMTSLPSGKIRESREDWGVSNGLWKRFQRGIYYEVYNAPPGANWVDQLYLEYLFDGQGSCPREYATRYNEDTDSTFCARMVKAADQGID